MSALDPASARRLKGALSRLDSNHSGEVIAAAAAVKRILANAGLSFSDLHVEQPGSEGWTPFRPQPVRLDGEHQREAFVLLVCGYAWDAWQRQFLSDMRQQRSTPSPKQQAKLRACRAMADNWRSRREATI